MNMKNQRHVEDIEISEHWVVNQTCMKREMFMGRQGHKQGMKGKLVNMEEDKVKWKTAEVAGGNRIPQISLRSNGMSIK